MVAIVNTFVCILRGFSGAIVSEPSGGTVIRGVILGAGWRLDYKVLTSGCRTPLESICCGLEERWYSFTEMWNDEKIHNSVWKRWQT